MLPFEPRPASTAATAPAALPAWLLLAIGLWFTAVDPEAAAAQDPPPVRAPTQAEEQARVLPLDTLEVDVGSRVSRALPTATRAVEIIDRERIETIPARNVAELLRWATSVDFMPRSPAQTDISIRGAGFEQVLVLVDGVPVSDRQTGHFDLSVTVPLDRVERVEVLRGPGSAVYGADAVGGVVNIVTRTSGLRWEGRMEGGSFGTGTLSVGGGTGSAGGFSVHGGAELSRSDGHRPGTDYEAALVHLRVAAPLGGGRLISEVGYADRGFGAEDFYGPFPAFETTRALTASARWRPDADDGLRIEPGLSLRRHEDDFILRRDDPDFYRNVHTTWQLGGDIVARYAGAGPWSVAAGVEGHHDILDSENLGDRSEARGAVFAEGVLNRGGATLSAGLRADAHETFGAFLSPSLSGSYDLAENFRLQASVGRAYRTPTWTERYYVDPANVGRADLDAERSWSGELGLRYAPTPGVTVTTAGFRRSSRDLIDWARASGTADSDGIPWETRNVKRATIYGLEAEVTLAERLPENVAAGPRARLSLGGSLLTLSTEEAAGLESKYALRPLTRQLHATFVRPVTLHSDLAIRGLVGKRAGEEHFHQVDARFSARLGSAGRLGSATLNLDVTNLFDARHPDVVGMPVAGRAFVAGISLSDVMDRQAQPHRAR